MIPHRVVCAILNQLGMIKNRFFGVEEDEEERREREKTKFIRRNVGNAEMRRAGQSNVMIRRWSVLFIYFSCLIIELDIDVDIDIWL